MSSNAFKKYVENKSIGGIRVGVTDAIYYGELSGNELKQLISELEATGKLNNAAIDRIPPDKWDSKYLELLKNESVGGTFSREYLEYMGEVYEHINKKKAENKNKLPAFLIGVAIILALASTGLAVKLKQNNDQKTTNKNSQTANMEEGNVNENDR